MFGVSADEGEQDPGSEERRLGVPALLRKVSPGRTAAGQERQQQDGGRAGETVHCAKNNEILNETQFNCVIYKSCLFPLSDHHREAKSVQ